MDLANLHFQNPEAFFLLRFCADPAGGGLLAQHSPFPFGIDCLRPNGDGDR